MSSKKMPHMIGLIFAPGLSTETLTVSGAAACDNQGAWQSRIELRARKPGI
jgi:hypothetical protein